MDAVGLPEIIAIMMVVSLNAYVITGGADFGGGAWDLLATGPRAGAQRALIAHELGPIWEANHVWLIFVIVILFTAFPPAFAALSTVLHIPLTIMLLGIVLRGSSFVFRSYGARDDLSQARWGRVFAIASTVTPVILGVIVGAVVSGAAGEAANAARAYSLGTSARAGPGFAAIYVTPWLAPFPLAVGAMALAMFAFLAAVYLAFAAHDDQLREDFRRRGLGAAAAMFVAAFSALAVARFSAPEIARSLVGRETLAFQAATAVAALMAIWALWTRRWAVARIAAAAQVSLILWGWVLVQYPFVIPPTLTVRAAAAPRATLLLLFYAVLAGAALLLPSL
ncbi:MAG TPA: cytochrome d ubiquinol oxidase subunit II, partial [Gemmatimonadaceae bacterium]|nr:cytochrome d ubiquinol oxidase subunit II [Gemmatimonadaceae bacterium]